MQLIGTAVGAYVLLVGAMFMMQRALLYPGAKDAPVLAQFEGYDIQEVATETRDGLRLVHWYRPPADPDGPVLVVFHGNAGHYGDRVTKLGELLDAGFGMLFAGYRGYSGNPGSPTEADLTVDANLLLDWLQSQGVGAERTILYGESLGTGVAVKMAATREAAAVILESPYTSIAELAQMHHWYLPARWLILDKWNSIDHIPQISAPLLVLHGTRDRTVPLRHGQELFEAAPEPKRMIVMDEAGHVDLFDYPEVSEQVIDFVRRHVPARS